MGARSGLALKGLQSLLRAVQLLCAALVLGVFAYFLAALHNHALPVATSVRAVAGIAGAGLVYALAGLVSLCCRAGLAFASAVTAGLDFCFAAAFVYVAVANRAGAGACSGDLDTPFGSGAADDTAPGADGFTALPSFGTACRLQTACLAAAVVAAVFFALSVLVDVALARHHGKAKRFGPGPANNYTSGYGPGRPGRPGRLARFFARFRRNPGAPPDDPNALPEHTHPDQLAGPARRSNATDATAVAPGPADYAKPEAGYGYGYQHGVSGGAALPQQPAPGTYRYGDGVYDRP